MNKENIKWLEKIIKNSCYNKDDNKNAQEILNFYNNEKDRWVLLPDDNDIVNVKKSKNNNSEYVLFFNKNDRARYELDFILNKCPGYNCIACNNIERYKDIYKECEKIFFISKNQYLKKNNNCLNLSKEEKQEIIDLLIERSLRYINKGFSEDEEKYFKNLIENIWFLCQEYNKKMPYSKKTILAVICGIEVENILTKVR